MTKRQRVIIDTDIGGDPDDAMAIALAVASPELHIEGITTVYDDVDYHARRIAKLLALARSGSPAAQTDIPIYNGLSATLLRKRKPPWAAAGQPAGEQRDQAASEHRDQAESGGDGEAGDLLDGTTPAAVAGRAVEFLIETVMKHPGEIVIVAIGPLTNIAAAIILEPRIAERVQRIIVMGGVARFGLAGADLPPIEHNIQCDPEAASVVFSSGAPLVMVGLDVTSKAVAGWPEVERLTRSGSPLNKALADVIRRWLRRIGMPATPLHDPLALALAIDHTLATTRRMRVDIVYDQGAYTGYTIAVPDEDGTVEVCLDVDSERFLRLLFHRLISNSS